jgi:4-amino-4-deoxy-L-arabinose transferase-like glycosyltransferase
MRRTGSLRFAVLVSVCSVVYLLFFYHLAERDLWSSHEARAGQDAQNMLTDGFGSVPHLFDRQLDLQKPPLYYWLVATVASVRGESVDAWAVRLPAALAGLLGVLGVAAFLWRLGRPRAGLIAALVLATSKNYTWLARVGRIDMPLTLAVGVALAAFYMYARASGGRKPSVDGAPSDHATSTGGLRPSLAWALLAYVAVAVAILLKGPIGAVLPAVVWASHLLVEGRWRPKWRTSLWWGVPLVLMLTVPWFWWANEQTNGQFFRVFFWKHNVARGFGNEETGAMHARPFWFYGAHLFGDLLPWALLLPAALWYFCRHQRWRQDAEARFGLVWLLSVLLLLSCLRFKRSDYLLPAYPGAALFLGCVAERWSQTLAHPRRWATAFGVIVIGCLGAWWYYIDVQLPRHEPEREMHRFAAEVRRIVPPPQGVLFFRTEAHALAFHLKPPLNTFLEWENLDIWAGRPGSHYIVMSPESAGEWPQHVTSGRLIEVLRCTQFHSRHERPLVLMRTQPGKPKTEARSQ